MTSGNYDPNLTPIDTIFPQIASLVVGRHSWTPLSKEILFKKSQFQYANNSALASSLVSAYLFWDPSLRLTRERIENQLSKVKKK